MKEPEFTLNDIKYAASSAIYKRARDLFESGKVKEVKETVNGYVAEVKGTQVYRVKLEQRRFDYSDCDCYMGQNGQFCKHILSLGLFVLHASGKMEENSQRTNSKIRQDEVKNMVTDAFKKIKPFRGPSSIWFSYQCNLATGVGMIIDAISVLPPSKESARYLWQVIGRIDRKLMNGVDDSDGVVGDCASHIIDQLVRYANAAPELNAMVTKFTKNKTNFCFEDELEQKMDISEKVSDT